MLYLTETENRIRNFFLESFSINFYKVLKYSEVDRNTSKKLKSDDIIGKMLKELCIGTLIVEDFL